MIITRSPLRISLGGGGTDLPSYYREHGGFLIAAAIAAFFSPAFAGFAANAQAASLAGEAVSNSDSTLRRLDSPSQATVAAAAQKDDSDDRAAPEEKKGRPRRHTADHQGDRVTIASDNHIAGDEKVPGDAVAVMGDLTVDGSVAGDAVAVIGDNTINGPVDGDAVAVMGDLKLGPKARVGGDALDRLRQFPLAGVAQSVAFGGVVHRDAGNGTGLAAIVRRDKDQAHFARRRSTASRISGTRSLPKYMSSPPTNMVGDP